MKKGTPMKKSALAAVRALVATIALGCVALLGACSGVNPEQLIIADLTTNLDLVKNADDETIDAIMSGIDATALEAYGVDGAEFAAALIDGFDYTIDEIDVEGDTATATLTITCKSATTLYGDLERLTTELLSDPAVYTMTEDELYAKIGELVLEAVNETEPRPITVEVVYTKADGEWAMDDASSTALSEVFL